MRSLLLVLVCTAFSANEDVTQLDGATDTLVGDALIDTGADTAPFDTGDFDTSLGGGCKDQGVPCSAADVCCGSLVCGNRTGTMVCSPPF